MQLKVGLKKKATNVSQGVPILQLNKLIPNDKRQSQTTVNSIRVSCFFLLLFAMIVKYKLTYFVVELIDKFRKKLRT